MKQNIMQWVILCVFCVKYLHYVLFSILSYFQICSDIYNNVMIDYILFLIIEYNIDQCLNYCVVFPFVEALSRALALKCIMNSWLTPLSSILFILSRPCLNFFMRWFTKLKNIPSSSISVSRTWISLDNILVSRI